MGNCFTKNTDLNLEALSFTPLREKYAKKKHINITIKIYIKYINHDKYNYSK